MVDTYVGNNKGYPIIVNTDTSNGPGVHWIVALRLPNGEPYVYDPLGPQNNRIGSQMIPADVFPNRAFGQKPHFYPYRSQLKSNSLWMACNLRCQSYIRRHPKWSNVTTGDR